MNPKFSKNYPVCLQYDEYDKDYQIPQKHYNLADQFQSQFINNENFIPLKKTTMNCLTVKMLSQLIGEDKKKNSIELAKIRIIQKTLVYVIGLSPQLAKEEVLLQKEYFGQYGQIVKIIVCKNNVFNNFSPVGPSYSAYITYSNEIEASMAIFAVAEFQINDRKCRASYGTTKYCSYFLRDQQCSNSDCLYLHFLDKNNNKNMFMKEDIAQNKNIFSDQQYFALQHLIKNQNEIISRAQNQKYITVLPSITQIIEKLQFYQKIYGQQIQQIEQPVEKKQKVQVAFKGWDMDDNEIQKQKNLVNRNNDAKNDNQTTQGEQKQENLNQQLSYHSFDSISDNEEEYSGIVNEIQDFLHSSSNTYEPIQRKKDDSQAYNQFKMGKDDFKSKSDQKQKIDQYSLFETPKQFKIESLDQLFQSKDFKGYKDNQNNDFFNKQQQQKPINNIIINHNNINFNVNNHYNIQNNFFKIKEIFNDKKQQQ